MKTSIVTDSVLPYRIEIDKLRGSGDSPSRATMAALSAGKRIPAGTRDRKEAASYIFWNYESNPDWVELISTLERDEFPNTICPECRQLKPDDERVRNGMKCGQCAY